MSLKKTKFGDYRFRVDFPVFGYAVFVVFSDDMEKSVKLRYNRMEAGPSYQAMHCRELGVPYSHLFFKIGDCPSGTIAHESWHVVRYLLADFCGCNLDNETVAYHLGYLVDRIVEFKNNLIEKGVGVKSKTQEVSNANQVDSAQGATNGVPRVYSRTTGPGEEREEIVPSETNRSSDAGRCCP
jgi:hypothetical protein